jgi:hypothetical protein
MRKMRNELVVGFFVVAAGAMLFAFAAQADSTNGALVLRDTGCGVFDGNGIYGSFTTNTQLVENNNTFRSRRTGAAGTSSSCPDWQRSSSSIRRGRPTMRRS